MGTYSIARCLAALAAVLVVALSGCTHLSSSAFNAPWIDSKQEVAAVTEQWATAFSKGDVDALTSMYSQDAVIWGISSSSMRTDPSAIREYYARLLKTFPGTRVTVREMNIRVYGDSAVNSGLLTIHRVSHDAGSKATPTRFSMVYVRRTGRWLIVDHHSSVVAF
jgi:uncharacterized protein (TIGR02246 family)